MSMTKRHAFFTALAAGHLALVAGWGASRAPLAELGVAGKVAAWYGAMSGAQANYGFFAPDAVWQARATFHLEDAKGHTWTDTIERKSAGNESNLRLGGLVDNQFAGGPPDREQVRSWAAGMLARHPTAKTVRVQVESYQTPSMEQFRAGERPEWVTIYEETFTRISAVSGHRVKKGGRR
jgi:hypothetical protein